MRKPALGLTKFQWSVGSVKTLLGFKLPFTFKPVCICETREKAEVLLEDMKQDF